MGTMGLTAEEKLLRLFGTAVVFAYPPKSAKDVRAAGGQFAKGGGRVPGRGAGVTKYDSQKELLTSTGLYEEKVGWVGDHGRTIDEGEASFKELQPVTNRLAIEAGQSWTFEGAEEHLSYKTPDNLQGVMAEPGVHQAVHDYTLTNAYGMNRDLRNGVVSDEVRLIDRAFEGAGAPLPSGAVLFRGERDRAFPSDLAVGSRVSNPGFTSTSTSPYTAAKQHAGLANLESSWVADATVYRIRASGPTKGKNVITASTEEREVLLPRDSTFVITGLSSFTRPVGTITVVDMEWAS